MIKTRRVAGPDGQVSEVRERRAAGLHNLAAVRAFYLDIAQWAMEDRAAGHRGPRRARSAPRTWPGRRRSAPASPAWTSAPGNGCRSCPSGRAACTPPALDAAARLQAAHATAPGADVHRGAANAAPEP